MDSNILKQHLESLVPGIVFAENRQYTEVVVPADQLHLICKQLRFSAELQFDYQISLTAIDWKDHFMLVCHLTSSVFRHILVVKSKIDDRDHPSIDTLSDIWKTSEYHEREVYDLFGISFRNHPDMRRLFLEDDYGFPLWKDFTDESRMIVR
jgi:NADH-quinone oxidoreductase subunit C